MSLECVKGWDIIKHFADKRDFSPIFTRLHLQSGFHCCSTPTSKCGVLFMWGFFYWLTMAKKGDYLCYFILPFIPV